MEDIFVIYEHNMLYLLIMQNLVDQDKITGIVSK